MIFVSKSRIFYVIIACFITFNSLIKPTYDWDFDHEIYYATRLLHGELLWTHEFHDKLPLVPFLLAIPALFRTIIAFKLFSLFTIIGTSLFSISYIRKKIGVYSNDIEKLYFHQSMFLFILYISYGSILTINCFSVCFYVIFLLISSSLYFSEIPTSYLRFKVFILASCFAALSISIRPYYLPSVVGVLVTSIILSLKGYKYNIINSFIILLKEITIWGSFIAIWGFLFNIFPYCITGHISSFIDGLLMLGQNINPLNGPKSFFSQAEKYPDIFFWISFISMPIFLIFLKKKYSNTINIFYSAFVGNSILIITICFQHYWTHYIQMFVGGFCICLCMLLLNLDKSKKIQITIFSIYLIITIFLIKNVFSIIHDTREIRTHPIPYYISSQNNWDTRSILQFLNTYSPQKKPDFLFPENMKVHWMLDQSRHHFLHAANSQFVAQGYFQNVTLRSSSFFVDTTPEEYCSRIYQEGPKLIFITSTYFLKTCLNDKISPYLPVTSLPHKEGTILVYQRKQKL